MTILALLALLAAPARAQAPNATLTYALASDVDSLDPDWAYDATSLFVIQQVYESLVDYDNGALDRFQPRLAAVVPTVQNGFLSRDGRTYAFPLRSDARFHDGSLMTAEDVKYSLMRFMLMDRDGGPSALLLRPLTGRGTVLGPDGKPDPEVYDLADKAVSIEGGAVVIRLPVPFAPLLSVLAGSGQIVSRKFAAAHGGWDGKKETWTRFVDPAKTASGLYADADGTGPFRLERWDRDLKTLSLARNDRYWRSPANLAAARLLTIEDTRARRRMLESGDADVAQVDARSAEAFGKIPGATVDSGLPLMEVDDVILLNEKIEARDNPWLGSGRLDGQGVPPDFFSSLAVRRGFAWAFDVDEYIRDGFRGAAVRALGPIPSGLPGYNKRQRSVTFSLEASAKSFREALGADGWASGFLLPVAYPEGDGERRAACRVLQEGLAQVNPKFRVDCRGLSQTRLLEELRARRLAAAVYRWVLDYPDPHNAVEPFLHSRGYFASALSYSNPRADGLVDAAAEETDPAKRKALYYELQAAAAYDVPAIFTVETTGALARRVSVQNWTRNPMQPYGSLYEVTKLP